MRRALVAAWLGCTFVSCGLSHDAPVRRDSGTIELDDGAIVPLCPLFDTTVSCGAECPAACPAEKPACAEPFGVCRVDNGEWYSPLDTPVHRDACAIDVRWGEYYCPDGRLCAVDVSPPIDPEGEEWLSGMCVDPRWCTWDRDGGFSSNVQCRYSDALPYANGPPEMPCGTGAAEESPFCGGACGEACPSWHWSYHDRRYSCVGISEERSFGVCAPLSARCAPGPTAFMGLQYCEALLSQLPDATELTPCACMVLAPALVPELADHGWPVALPSCLAYRDHFPDRVRCFDAAWNEI
jgi:hypothetical protein